MNATRIPAYERGNPDGMAIWFAEMANRNMIFHPEDAPETIEANGVPVFSEPECKKIKAILAQMFAEHGDRVTEACYPIFMRKAGFLHALDA